MRHVTDRPAIAPCAGIRSGCRGHRENDRGAAPFGSTALIRIAPLQHGRERKLVQRSGRVRQPGSELQENERVRISIAAALGGMVVPATAYVAVNAVFENGQIAAWAIPMATDTAIAIAILMALGSRVHKAVVAFLVGVAIIDDIGATLVIALRRSRGSSLGCGRERRARRGPYP